MLTAASPRLPPPAEARGQLSPQPSPGDRPGGACFPGFWSGAEATNPLPGAAATPKEAGAPASAAADTTPELSFLSQLTSLAPQAQPTPRRAARHAGPAHPSGEALLCEQPDCPGSGDDRAARRVRFALPEEESALAAQPRAPRQLPGAPAEPPGTIQMGLAVRPGTPAKPMLLHGQPPKAFSRFGSTAFQRPFAGAAARRGGGGGGLVSFTVEGAACVALPPVPAAYSAARDAADAAADDMAAAALAAGRGPGSSAAAAAAQGVLSIPRRLQQRHGLHRRTGFAAVPDSPQGPEALALALREALVNARLAEAWAGGGGESWARLDLAGLEFPPGDAAQHAQRRQELVDEVSWEGLFLFHCGWREILVWVPAGSSNGTRESEGLAPLLTRLLACLPAPCARLQLCGEVRERQGEEAAGDLLARLELEWQHLRRVRMQYLGQAPRSPAAGEQRPEQADAEVSCRCDTGPACICFFE